MGMFGRYLRNVLLGAAFLVAIAAGIDVLVDPYGLFGTPRVAGWNALKPFAGDRGRTTKLYQVRRIAPHALIVGNSRAELGLAPNHPCWPAAAQPVYNTAIPGLSVYSQVRYAQHALATGNVSTMVMSVDFVDFLNRAPAPDDPTLWPPRGTDVRAERFAVDPSGQPTGGLGWSRLSDYFEGAVSLEGLLDSMVTVARQRQGLVPTITEAGFNPGEAIYEPVLRHEGVRVLFAQKEREFAQRFAQPDLRVFTPGTDWSPDFEAVRRLLRQARERRTTTTLFISPLHAEFLLIIEAAGLWDQFDAWKQRMARMAREEGVPLWDFNRFDRYSSEVIDQLPERGTGLKWFWEPSHYRVELGQLMLDNMLRATCPSDRKGSPEYGARLDQEGSDRGGLGAYLATERERRDAFKRAHPEVMARIRALF